MELLSYVMSDLLDVGQTQRNNLYFAPPCPNLPKLPVPCLYSGFASQIMSEEQYLPDLYKQDSKLIM